MKNKVAVKSFSNADTVEFEVATIEFTNGATGKIYERSIWSDTNTKYVFLESSDFDANDYEDIALAIEDNLEQLLLEDLIIVNEDIENALNNYTTGEIDDFYINIKEEEQRLNSDIIVADIEIAETLNKSHVNKLKKQDIVDLGKTLKAFNLEKSIKCTMLDGYTKQVFQDVVLQEGIDNNKEKENIQTVFNKFDIYKENTFLYSNKEKETSIER